MFNVQTQLITSKGYPCEDHTVTTADGFILGLQRIPHGKQNLEEPASRPVVFLQHGLLDSAVTWVMNLANESLGMHYNSCAAFLYQIYLPGRTFSVGHCKTWSRATWKNVVDN